MSALAEHLLQADNRLKDGLFSRSSDDQMSASVFTVTENFTVTLLGDSLNVFCVCAAFSSLKSALSYSKFNCRFVSFPLASLISGASTFSNLPFPQTEGNCYVSDVNACIQSH